MDWESKDKLKLQYKTDSNTQTSFVSDEKQLVGEWDPTRWFYRETTYEEFLNGTLVNLIAKLPGEVVLPEQYGWCFGPATIGDTSEISKDHFYPYSERLWVVWKNNAGQMWRAKSNAEFTDWEDIRQILFIPSGANNPSICFDENGNYVLAVDLVRPGLTDKEVWLLEYPYNGNYIRKICNGERPKLFMDNKKDVLLFYHDDVTSPGNTKIRYRAKSQGYNTDNTLPVNIGGIKTVNAIRFYYYGPEEKPDYYLAAILFYKVSTEKITRYIKTKVLEERPVIVIPTQPEQGESGFIDNYSLAATFAGIQWFGTQYETMSQCESYNIQSSLTGISWFGMIFETKQMSDSYSVSVGINAADWKEISFEAKSEVDSYTVQAEVKSILWIQI